MTERSDIVLYISRVNRRRVKLYEFRARENAKKMYIYSYIHIYTGTEKRVKSLSRFRLNINKRFYAFAKCTYTHIKPVAFLKRQIKYFSRAINEWYNITCIRATRIDVTFMIRVIVWNNVLNIDLTLNINFFYGLFLAACPISEGHAIYRGSGPGGLRRRGGPKCPRRFIVARS